MSSKYKQHNVIKIRTYKHNVIKIRKVKNKSYTTTTSNPTAGLGLADVVVAASSASGLASCQDRRDLLPNMAHGLKPLLRAHDLLLTHLRIRVGNSDTNHVIGISRASRIVPLPLLCNDLLFICWPRKISWKRWQNLRGETP